MHPDDLRSLADLARFPFTTKQDLRDNYPFGMFAVPQDRVAASMPPPAPPANPRWSATRCRTSIRATVMARSIRAAGARRGDKVHVSYGYGLFTGGTGAHYGVEKAGLATIGGGQTGAGAVDPDFKPEVIMVTPSYMLALADEFERQGIDPASTSLKVGIFGAEPGRPDAAGTGKAHGHLGGGHLACPR